jgi:nicotinate phosphoribosyltransferase
MSFDSEPEAFAAYAAAMPNNCVFLVDTYDTLEGVQRAVAAGRALRERGHKMSGIRLDSGDLANLSVEARRILDEAGFQDAAIVASNDLDEHIIASLKEQGARISVWGVGTKLVTGYDQPAMGGVYKLAAVRKPGGPWRYKVKLSEQAIKVSTPGIQQIRRYRDASGFIADMIYDEQSGAPDPAMIVDPLDATRRRRMPAGAAHSDLLVPVFRGGRPVYDSPSLGAMREFARSQLSGFHAGIKRFVHPHAYPVGLELGLHELKTRLVLEARGVAE